MRYLIRRVLILSFTLSLTLAVIIGMPHSNTNRLAFLFTNADDSRCKIPCLFGVTPNWVPFEDGVALLKANPAFKLRTWTSLSEIFRDNVSYDIKENNYSARSNSLFTYFCSL